MTLLMLPAMMLVRQGPDTTARWGINCSVRGRDFAGVGACAVGFGKSLSLSLFLSACAYTILPSCVSLPIRVTRTKCVAGRVSRSRRRTRNVVYKRSYDASSRARLHVSFRTSREQQQASSGVCFVSAWSAAGEQLRSSSRSSRAGKSACCYLPRVPSPHCLSLARAPANERASGQTVGIRNTHLFFLRLVIRLCCTGQAKTKRKRNEFALRMGVPVRGDRWRHVTG